jgi:PIN domain nuclease of toxin-antitoxin system
MRLLLDTHAFIWWDSEPSNLSAAALSALQDPTNEVLSSAVSTWEMVIKADLGKLSLRLPLDEIVRQQRESNGVRLLPVTIEHTLAVRDLPPVHKDPFDRLLVA